MPNQQKVIDLLLDSKGVRLDINVSDDKNVVYNIEMQKGKSPNLTKRSRYYQGAIDLDLISKGEDYEKLQTNICTFDPFKKNRHLYTFINRCEEDDTLRLGDEATKIFLNTHLDDVDDEMIEFLSYIENSTDTLQI